MSLIFVHVWNFMVILSRFKVIERTRFCHRNWNLQSSKGNNSKLYNQELWFFHSVCNPMLVNISMKFHEDILNGFKVIELTHFWHRNYYLQSSKGHNSNIYIQEFWFLRPARCLMLINISMKFHEDILNGFQVTERTRFRHWNCY